MYNFNKKEQGDQRISYRRDYDNSKRKKLNRPCIVMNHCISVHKANKVKWLKLHNPNQSALAGNHYFLMLPAPLVVDDTGGKTSPAITREDLPA